jgi:hypothetical protein
MHAEAAKEYRLVDEILTKPPAQGAEGEDED